MKYSFLKDGLTELRTAMDEALISLEKFGDVPHDPSIPNHVSELAQLILKYPDQMKEILERTALEQHNDRHVVGFVTNCNVFLASDGNDGRRWVLEACENAVADSNKTDDSTNEPTKRMESEPKNDSSFWNTLGTKIECLQEKLGLIKDHVDDLANLPAQKHDRPAASKTRSASSPVRETREIKF